MRGFIKEAFLNMLQHENKIVLQAASISLGVIAAIEVPEGHWDQFLEIMQSNSTAETYEHRLASVQTMGFMVEFLSDYIGK